MGGAAFAAQPTPSNFPDEAKVHGWRMLDTHPRARSYASWCTLSTTETQFRAMQVHYRPQDFDRWTKKLRQLRPGMTEKQVLQSLGPKESLFQFIHNDVLDNQVRLNDAYFADLFFDKRTRRIMGATPPLAITYDVKADHKRPSKT
jgi:hypothetical protein